MKIWSQIEQARSKDRAIEDRAGIRRRDPQADKTGRVYTPSDIRALELERAPWLARRKRPK